MSIEKRRSDRIMFTIPLTIRGRDPEGKPYEADARTIGVNRHGARIQAACPLQAGQTIHIHNDLSQGEADFRVVGPVYPPTDRVGEWGVECTDEKKNIWGIYFPPPLTGAARGLLECRSCHSVGVTPLSFVEVEVLETSGILSKLCENCGQLAPRGYPEKQLAMVSPDFQAMFSSAAERIAPTADRRAQPRSTLQVPARIRDYYGGSEVVQTENLSKEGMCLISGKTYYLGQGLMIACPYDPDGRSAESRARVVRVQLMFGSSASLYGICYERQGN